MNQSSLYQHIKLPIQRVTLAISVMFAVGSALAFDELNPVQTMLWDKPHLVNTEIGQSISYDYTSVKDQQKPVEDKVIVNITAEVDEERRDVSIDFLSAERRMMLPVFSGYRGNPVLMAMLEHMVQNISAETGGGALYFRNRIRDALASDDVKVDNQTLSVNNEEVDATVLQFQPFRYEDRLGPDSIYGDAVFTITLSDNVPGGIVGVGISAAPERQSSFNQQIKLIQ